MTERYDAIVIGAGHNGLVCSTLLAKAGRKVLVLEANDQTGGAAITREFADGYSVSACAHLLYQLQPEVVKDMGVRPSVSADNIETIALAPDGNHIRLRIDDVVGVSEQDAERYRQFRKRMNGFADLIRIHLNKTPPRLGTRNLRDIATLGKLGFDLRRLGRVEMQEFLRVIAMNIHDEVNERFESASLKGAISLDAVLGTHLGPRSPNTIFTYLYRLAGTHGRLTTIKGGMGALSSAFAHAAQKAGADIRTNTAVARIVVENGRVTGVETETGERFSSYKVISNADPKRTVVDLLGPRHLESGFANRISRVRTRGNAAKLHLALDGLPNIDGLSKKDFGGRILIAPDEHYVERAFNPAKYGETSQEPVIEMTFPSLRDESLAPAGRHVMSAVVQYAPYTLARAWDASAKTDFEKTIVETLSKFIPDIKQRTLASELLTPLDIEREFHITGGHWHHGELVLDQFFFVRPVAGAARYKLPIDGLYLCGAGAHPGGGISGAAGRNAARHILREGKGA